jgi:hypothetical protein
MGANTTYFVTVYKLHEEVIEVQAVTRGEAEEEALRTPGVAGVKEVLHWTERKNVTGER